MKRIALTTGRLGGVTVAETNPESPIPCVNCGSPACEWPGRCAQAAPYYATFDTLHGEDEAAVWHIRYRHADGDSHAVAEVFCGSDETGEADDFNEREALANAFAEAANRLVVK
jgi:hypothetical protein